MKVEIEVVAAAVMVASESMSKLLVACLAFASLFAVHRASCW